MKREQPFSRLASVPTPRGFEDRLAARIDRERARAGSRRFFVFVAAAISSLAAFGIVLAQAWSALSSSGFTQFVSLIFSDGGSVLGYSRELGLALLESLPVESVALSLLLALVFGWSLSRAVRGRSGIGLKTA